MPRAYLYRSGFAFFPASNADTEIMYHFQEGEVVELDVKKARNYKFHKKFFALLNVGFALQKTFDNFDWFRYWITIKAGYFESCQAPNGKWMFRPKSISFETLDQIEFEKVYKDVSAAIIRECHVTQEILEDNLTLFY